MRAGREIGWSDGLTRKEANESPVVACHGCNEDCTSTIRLDGNELCPECFKSVVDEKQVSGGLFETMKNTISTDAYIVPRTNEEKIDLLNRVAKFLKQETSKP